MIVAGLGGAIVKPETLEAEQKHMVGSMMVYEAENIDIVRNLILNDPYYTGGVVSRICCCSSRGSEAHVGNQVGQGEARYHALDLCLPASALGVGIRVQQE